MRPTAAAALILLAIPLPHSQRDRLASGLQPGMQLIYESEGERQPPWTVDSVLPNAGPRPDSECARVAIRRMPGQTTAEATLLCVSRDTLYQWDMQRQDWSISRPVGPGMTWTSHQPNTDVVRYETADTASESISGRTIRVLHTTVTTSDSSGRPKRRLRERYALSLTTATGGTFETADSSRAGAWVPQRSFELKEIRALGSR